MSHTFIKLPTGDIAIDHTREVYEDLKHTTFQYMMWTPRPALVDKNGKTIRLYTEQEFDPAHADRPIYFISIGGQENQNTQTEGYFNGSDWVCKSCCETILASENLEAKLAELPQYKK